MEPIFSTPVFHRLLYTTTRILSIQYVDYFSFGGYKEHILNLSKSRLILPQAVSVPAG